MVLKYSNSHSPNFCLQEDPRTKFVSLPKFPDWEKMYLNHGIGNEAEIPPQGFFSEFWDNDPYPWNWEFKCENAQNWDFLGCFVIMKHLIID